MNTETVLPAERGEEGTRVVIPDGDALLIDVADMAAREAMYVIHNGQRVIVCSTVPVGWKRLGINERRPPLPQQSTIAAGGVQ